MIKKAIFTTVLLTTILALTCVCIADDAGTFLDKDRNLIVNIYPYTDEIEIGSEFTFQVKATNTTFEPVHFYSVASIFNSKYNHSLYYDVDFPEVPPYETVRFDVTCTVPPNINWYEYHGKYYVEMGFTALYETIANRWYDLDRSGEYMWEHKNVPVDTHTLEITNLNDGSEIADMHVTSDNTLNYCLEAWEHGIYGYSPCYSSNVELTNNHSTPLTVLSVNNYDYTQDNVQIMPQQMASYDEQPYLPNYLAHEIADSYDVLMISELPDVVTLQNRVLFMADDKYYCIDDHVRLQMRTHKYRDLRVWICPDENNIANTNGKMDYIVKFKNSAENDMKDVVFILKMRHSNTTIMLPEILSGETVEYPIALYSDNSDFFYTCGWSMGKNHAMWCDILCQLEDAKYYSAELDTDIYYRTSDKYSEIPEPIANNLLQPDIHLFTDFDESIGTITNNTSSIINNLAFVNGYSIDDHSNPTIHIIPALLPNEGYTFQSDYFNYATDLSPTYGVIDNDILYLWNCDCTVTDGIIDADLIGCTDELHTYGYGQSNDIYTEFQTEIIKPYDIAIDTHTASSTTSVTPAPTASPTLQPDENVQNMNISNIQYNRRFPLWAWILLITAVISSCLVIFYLRKKQ